MKSALGAAGRCYGNVGGCWERVMERDEDGLLCVDFEDSTRGAFSSAGVGLGTILLPVNTRCAVSEETQPAKANLNVRRYYLSCISAPVPEALQYVCVQNASTSSLTKECTG